MTKLLVNAHNYNFDDCFVDSDFVSDNIRNINRNNNT